MPCSRPAGASRARACSSTCLRPYRQGFIEASSLAEALTDDTVLVSVQAANSEAGAIQPIRELAALAHERDGLFHTDAVQALGKMPLDVQKLGVDAASFSAHKIGGPKGVGALYLKARTPFAPYLLGGGQESGRRSGTQNVAGVSRLRRRPGGGQEAEPEEARPPARPARPPLCGHGLHRRHPAHGGGGCGQPRLSPATSSTAWPMSGRARPWHLRFDELGICVAGGSACSSHSLEPSHVLRAMGVTGDTSYNALRISMGRYTTEADISGLREGIKGEALNW